MLKVFKIEVQSLFQLNLNMLSTVASLKTALNILLKKHFVGK